MTRIASIKTRGSATSEDTFSSKALLIRLYWKKQSKRSSSNRMACGLAYIWRITRRFRRLSIMPLRTLTCCICGKVNAHPSWKQKCAFRSICQNHSMSSRFWSWVIRLVCSSNCIIWCRMHGVLRLFAQRS